MFTERFCFCTHFFERHNFPSHCLAFGGKLHSPQPQIQLQQAALFSMKAVHYLAHFRWSQVNFIHTYQTQKKKNKPQQVLQSVQHMTATVLQTLFQKKDNLCPPKKHLLKEKNAETLRKSNRRGIPLPGWTDMMVQQRGARLKRET